MHQDSMYGGAALLLRTRRSEPITAAEASVRWRRGYAVPTLLVTVEVAAPPKPARRSQSIIELASARWDRSVLEDCALSAVCLHTTLPARPASQYLTTTSERHGMRPAVREAAEIR